jgi:hypothetical protein
MYQAGTHSFLQSTSMGQPSLFELPTQQIFKQLPSKKPISREPTPTAQPPISTFADNTQSAQPTFTSGTYTTTSVPSTYQQYAPTSGAGFPSGGNGPPDDGSGPPRRNNGDGPGRGPSKGPPDSGPPPSGPPDGGVGANVPDSSSGGVRAPSEQQRLPNNATQFSYLKYITPSVINTTKLDEISKCLVYKSAFISQSEQYKYSEFILKDSREC